MRSCTYRSAWEAGQRGRWIGFGDGFRVRVLMHVVGSHSVAPPPPDLDLTSPKSPFTLAPSPQAEIQEMLSWVSEKEDAASDAAAASAPEFNWQSGDRDQASWEMSREIHTGTCSGQETWCTCCTGWMVDGGRSVSDRVRGERR